MRRLPRAEQAAEVGLSIAVRFHAVTDCVNRLGGSIGQRLRS